MGPSKDRVDAASAIGDRTSRWRQPERILAVASGLLLAANLLLIIAVFLNFAGGTSWWNAGETVWVALWTDLVGAALMGSVFFAIANRGEGRSYLYRRIVGSFLISWVLVTAFWRFAVPGLAGTDLQDLFVPLITAAGGVPAGITRDTAFIEQILGLWIVGAAVFFGAHVVMVLDRRGAAADDWVRGLPVYAWTVAAGISLVATVSIALSLLAALTGGPLAGNFNLALLAKLIVAPNIFISGYASSLQLGREMARRQARPAEG